ncbi:cellulose biosynthesis protein BcsG [Aeromonas caviae]|nr:cellulose biosynthesis protein BcsG [Aeromonas caviae]
MDWHGLGGWNVYFLAKFALLWGGYLNFYPLINLVFAAFLIFPLPRAARSSPSPWITGRSCSGVSSIGRWSARGSCC